MKGQPTTIDLRELSYGAQIPNTVHRNLPLKLALLQQRSLDEVRRRIGHAHDELESAALVQLQQAFIRIPYAIHPAALVHFGEVSLSLQKLVRQLLKHYILERELLQVPGDADCFDRATPKPFLDRLRRDHQILQETLSDLQFRTEKLHDTAHAPASLRFSQLLDSLANRLHEQILEEDRVLFPRSGRP